MLGRNERSSCQESTSTGLEIEMGMGKVSPTLTVAGPAVMVGVAAIARLDPGASIQRTPRRASTNTTRRVLRVFGDRIIGPFPPLVLFGVLHTLKPARRVS